MIHPLQLSEITSIRRLEDQKEENRRCCFEIIIQHKSLVCQAETESEMNAWIQSIELARKQDQEVPVDLETTYLQSQKSEDTDSEMGHDSEPTIDSGTLTRDPMTDTEELKSEVSYPTDTLTRRNEQLHTLLKSVPPEDFLLDCNDT
jgi:hypothetical protein